MLITSPANQYLRRARGVRDGREAELIFVEGERLCEDLVRSSLTLSFCFHSPAPTLRAQEIIAAARRRECEVFAVADEALDAVSDTVNSQGLIMLAQRPQISLAQLLTKEQAGPALLVCLDVVQDPGNVGTIVRTAEAAGAGGVIALRGSADPFAPKTLRSAMGSSFRLPIVDDVAPDELFVAVRAAGLRIVATAAEVTEVYDRYDWRPPALIVLGNEANGIRPEVMTQCDGVVSIPMQAAVNSLNVATAAAALLFEAARQRRAG